MEAQVLQNRGRFTLLKHNLAECHANVLMIPFPAAAMLHRRLNAAAPGWSRKDACVHGSMDWVSILPGLPM